MEEAKGGRFASIIIRSDAGKFLAVHHHKKLEKQWRFPGGKVAPGEIAMAAAARELKKELGIEALELKFSSSHNISIDDGFWVGDFFLCTRYEGSPQIMEPQKFDEIHYFSPQELLNLDSHPEYEAVASFDAAIESEQYGGNPWIQTFTGLSVHLLHPNVDEIRIADIAHSLAFQCRYTGHCLRYESVAEHSIIVSEMVPSEDERWGLMHDASEAYLQDMSRPLKHHTELGAIYGKLEEPWMLAIAAKFDLPWPIPQSVKEADKTLLHLEIDENMRSGLNLNTRVSSFYRLNPQEAEERFLKRYALLFEGKIL
jgi:8-oxo-dGTP pyrophosphatase MutT (NUDIX family)